MRLIRANVERIAQGELAEKLRKMGFLEIDAIEGAMNKPEFSEISEQDAEVLSKLSLAKLRSFAAQKGIENADTLRKNELLEALKGVI